MRSGLASAGTTGARSRRAEPWLFGALLGLQLLPLWAFAYVPTQDGPAHLENAAILLRRSAVGIWGRFYVPNFQLVPNWLGHGVLAALLSLFPPLVAEKVALSGYALALPLAFRYALPPYARARGFALGILPFIFGYAFYMGFASFCLSLALFFVAILLWRQFRGRLGARGAVALGLVSLFVALGHAVTLGALVLTLASLTLGRAAIDLARARDRDRRASLFRHHARLSVSLAVSLLPAVLLVFAFTVSGVEGYSLGWVPFGRRLSGLAVLLSIVAMSPADLWVSAAVSASIVLAVFGTLWARRRNLAPGLEWLLAAVATLALALASPDSFGHGWGMTLRLQVFPFALALIWLGTGPVVPLLARVVPFACALASLALIGMRIPIQARLSQALEEYTSVAPYVAKESVFLPLQLTFGRDLDRTGLFPLNFGPLLHAGGYIAVARDSVDLANYEASKTLFPMRYRPELNPYLRLARGAGFEGEGALPCVDLEAGQDLLGIDYIIVWGPLQDAIGDPCVRDWTRELATSYRLVYQSRPRGFAQVWSRKASPKSSALAPAGAGP